MTKENLANLFLSVILVLLEVPLVLLSGWFLVALVTRKPFDSQGLLLLSFPLTFALVFGVLAWRGFASINVVEAAISVKGWRIVAALCVLIGLMAGAVNWVGMLLPFSVAVVCLQADPKVRKFFMSLHPKHKSSLQVFTIAGASVHIHYWSLMGLCLLVAFIVHFDPELIIFSCIGYAVIIGVHEAGHAIAARMNGLKVFEIHFSGKGGLCRLETPRQYGEALFVYSAGVFAQLVLLGVTLLYLLVFGEPTSAWEACLVFWFTVVNVLVIFGSLIPSQERKGWPPSDGFVLWKLLLFKYQGMPYLYQDLPLVPQGESPVFAPSTTLLSMPELIPEGFVQGVEILNDNTTPGMLVIALLRTHFHVKEIEAIKWMVDIHNKGGMLVPLPDYARAQEHLLIHKSLIRQLASHLNPINAVEHP